MKNFLQKLFIWALILLLSSPAHAVDLNSYSLLGDKNGPDRFTGRGSEYVSGAQTGSVLMRVNLWGAVGKPGIHHVPAKTNLINLLSYAGGPQATAELDRVIIKRNTGAAQKKILVNVQDIIEGASIPQIPLEPNDIVVVPAEEAYVSSNTVVLVGVIALSLIHI